MSYFCINGLREAYPSVHNQFVEKKTLDFKPLRIYFDNIMHTDLYLQDLTNQFVKCQIFFINNYK